MDNLKMSKLTLTAHCSCGGQAIVEFTENGYRMIEDTREIKTGYLHCDDKSPESVTDKVVEQLCKYFFNHYDSIAGSPGMGFTPQEKYMSHLNAEQREQIGNDGKQGMYA